MDIAWNNVIKEIGSTTVIVAIIGWVLKSTITHWLDKNIDSYKNELKATAEKEIETTKAKLQVKVLERGIVYEQLIMKRTEILETLYKLLREAHDSAYLFGGSLIFGTRRVAEPRAESAIEKVSECYRYYSINKIYFTKNLDKKISDFFTYIHGGAREYLQEIDSIQIIDDVQKQRDIELEFAKRLPEMESEINELLQSIESEFRKITGAHN